MIGGDWYPEECIAARLKIAKGGVILPLVLEQEDPVHQPWAVLALIPFPFSILGILVEFSQTPST